MTRLSRRALLAGALTAAVPLAGCTAPLYVTTVTVANTTDDHVAVYVGAVTKRLVDADSREWTVTLEPGTERTLTFETGQKEATEVIVDPSTGASERLTVGDSDVRAEVTDGGARLLRR